MGSKYNQLTHQDRVFLRIMIDKKYPKAKIAKVLKVHRSTIYRELKRNSWQHWASKNTHYDPMSAQNKYLKRRKRLSKIQRDLELKHYVESKLSKGWSPKAIEGRLRVHSDINSTISHESIYRYIYSDFETRNRLYRKLRRKHPVRRHLNSKRRKVPSELLIDNRADTINNREEFGHWECDLMIFKRGIKGNLITLRERKSRYSIALKNENKTSQGTALRIISMLKSLKNNILSITFDQGSEFMNYKWIAECLEAEPYFCYPGSPHQKGAIENVNGVIRCELPRSTDIAQLKQRDVNAIIKEINERPMACLNYQTPQEVFTDMAK